jgi:hypothetical protein
MIPSALTMLAAALTFVVDPSLCRQNSTGRTGAANWNSDGKDHLSISVDAPSVGDVSLQCSLRIPPGVRSVTLSLEHILVSFQPAGSKETGSGLVMTLGPSCQASVTRVAGEDWIEARSRKWTAVVPEGSRSIVLRVAAHDASSRDPVRLDVTGLKVQFGNDHSDCP